MTTFLLKKTEQLSKNAVAKVAILEFAPSKFLYKALTIAIVSLTSIAYAEQPLSDAELDAKYIEVKIIPVCTTEKVEEKDNNKAKTGDTEVTKRSCHDANYFVAVVTNQVDTTGANNTAQSKDGANAELLLSSVFDNIRLLGGSDVLGVPAGIANTGVPLMFGSENYSTKWSGNYNQIFQPTLYDLIAPYSVYDTSNLGYGFREEAHFPQNIPQPTIIAITSHN